MKGEIEAGKVKPGEVTLWLSGDKTLQPMLAGRALRDARDELVKLRVPGR